MLKTRILFSSLFSILLLSASCGSDSDDTIAPKPHAFYRITYPEKKYITYDSTCPYAFEMPVYSQLVKDQFKGAKPCWLNLNFPTFNGTLHLSYEQTNNLQGYIDDTYTLATKHQVKASGIDELPFANDSLHVYGLLYSIEGNAASSVQFYLTDSVDQFFRGALYFNAVPNTDSIKPVINFIREDINHLIETFRWKKYK